MKSFLCLSTATLCVVGLASATNGISADVYPSKPIRMIVAYPPGGGTDIIARLIGDKLGKELDRTIIIDNRPGANGNIGSEIAANAPPDGYTLLMGTANLTVNPSLYRKLGYQTLKDFAPVSLVTQTPNILVVHPSVPVKSVRELIAFAKAEPGKLNFSSNGAGSVSHLAGELLKSDAGIDILHIPYKGAGPGITALITGEVQLMFANPLAVLPHIAAGKLRALAITSSKRSAALPELPTMEESGLPDFVAVSWYGILAPAGTPEDIVLKLNRAVLRGLSRTDLHDHLLKGGSIPIGNTSRDFAVFIEAEMVKWAKVIKKSGANAE
jgi:tripartite-type tricarboxylate transporter receptor subunit TctC